MKEYKTVSEVHGPVMIVRKVSGVGYGEICRIRLPSGENRLGQVMKISGDVAVVEVFEGTVGIDTKNTSVAFLGESFMIPVSDDMPGLVFDGLGRCRDGKIITHKRMDVNGVRINPDSRGLPKDSLVTGFSAIDGMLTIIKGQKLPVFSESGLDHNRLVAEIAQNVSDMLVIIVAIGITHDELEYFRKVFMETGSFENIIVFANLSTDPVIERVVTPRAALTTAEYFAWEKGRDVLVILTDMTNYANALREISSSKEEIPSRRGYPSYLYSDLASIYERAGCLKNSSGSITQIPILTMPDGDITHPVPDLTGYITEGQIMLSPLLSRKGIFPPINVIPSLSRLMHHGIGREKTREDHKQLSDQMYVAYSKGKKVEKLKEIIGEDSLSDVDRKYLRFSIEFEKKFVNQDDGLRDVRKTLDLGWELIKLVPKEDLTKIDKAIIEKYYYH